MAKVTEFRNQVTKTRNQEITLNQSAFLNQNETVAGPTGIEPAAYGLRVRRSGLTELRARVACF